ncbi:MAG: DNA alkylation repair protein [Moraxellaceae bacterium]|nr:MAG: DNA alkylation repair protein [Moraxellaceae bacterium]
MAEPFKNLFNEKIIEGMAEHFKKQWSIFDTKGFKTAASNNLESLELKQRSDQIMDAMVQYLPTDFKKASKIMLGSLGTPLADDVSAGTVDANGIAGWAVMPMAHYVGVHGHDHFDLSMTLLREMTICSSSEFGIRFFLIKSPKETLAILKRWSKDDNQHVRRLVSEGSRPRLPWAMRLPLFITDPIPVIDLLERLKDDKKEYVRRSVANNLNDIAKDHPDLVADIAAQWMQGASDERKKMIRHACRTLIKNGHKKTLKVLGYGKAKIHKAELELLTPKVKFGKELQFTLSVRSKSTKEQALMIDYVIHHQKANGSTTPKVFKLRATTLAAKGSLIIQKKHAIKKITTRVYYPGTHKIEVIVNGDCVAETEFQLLMQSPRTQKKQRA